MEWERKILHVKAQSLSIHWLIIPDDGNVFYAMGPSENYHLLLMKWTFCLGKKMKESPLHPSSQEEEGAQVVKGLLLSGPDACWP
ncbi:ral guanine nucleotide dissociation stimulator-like [Tamandua tetradactyla]|uniref:ral guanine nucleotide dissociation stimulator-like n=1 Tax=Tamandua tetradactyla TaxID=48850 RepID=UPI0040538967